MGAPARIQPQGLVRINRSHPLARGLVMLLHPMYPGINLVDGSPLSDAYGAGSSFYPVKNIGGRALANNASSNYRILGAAIPPSPGLTAALAFVPRINITSSTSFVDISANGGWNSCSIILGDGSNPRIALGINAGDGYHLVPTPSNYRLHAINTVVATSDTSSQRIALNGAVVTTSAITPGKLGAETHNVTLQSPSSSAGAVEVGVLMVWNRPFSAGEAATLSQNIWQVFDGPAAYSAAAVSAPTVGATLVASAFTPSSSGAALATAISLRAAGVTVASSGAALMTSVTMNASSMTASSAGATLATATGISASSTTPSVAGAILATSTRLGAGANSPSNSSAALATSIAIAAGAVSPSTASASLVIGSIWSASSASPSNAGAALQTAVRIAAAGASTPSQASAALSTAIWFGARAASASTAAASLVIGTTWSASGVSASNAGATLLTAIRLAAVGAGVLSQAGAVLGTAVRLSATSMAPSSAGAVLESGIVKANYVRAPAGPGYAPHSHYNETRPAATSAPRPAATQRNNR